MRGIKQLSILGILLCVFSSCGFDKYKDTAEYDFYMKNESGSPVVFTLHWYERKTSTLPMERVISINKDECKPIFEGLVVGEGFSFDDEELFNDTLIGDLRDDSYAEIQFSDNKIKIRWNPNVIDEHSIYSPANWLFEKTERNGKIYKKWTFIIDASIFQ